MVLHMNTAQVLILKLIKQDHFYFFTVSQWEIYFTGVPERGSMRSAIHKPSRVRVVHYHYNTMDKSRGGY